MPAIQLLSISDSLAEDPAVGSAAVRLISRMHFLGLLGNIAGPTEIDRALLLQAFSRLAEVGVGRHVRALLQHATEPADYLHLLSEALDQIEKSPLPTTEWAPLIETLGEPRLAELLGISLSSLRRYAVSARPTPDEVAVRLHFLALLIADLSGAYNEYGIRRWFERPRSVLDGRPPSALLGSSFNPDAPETERLRNLAAALVGAGAT